MSISSLNWALVCVLWIDCHSLCLSFPRKSLIHIIIIMLMKLFFSPSAFSRSEARWFAGIARDLCRVAFFFLRFFPRVRRKGCNDMCFPIVVCVVRIWHPFGLLGSFPNSEIMIRNLCIESPGIYPLSTCSGIYASSCRGFSLCQRVLGRVCTSQSGSFLFRSGQPRVRNVAGPRCCISAASSISASLSSSSVTSLKDLAGCLEPARDPRCAGIVFQWQRWGNFCETGWSAYGLFRAHGYHLELSLTDLNVDVIVGQVTLTSLLRSPNIFFLSSKFALATVLHQSHKQGFALVTLLHQSHKQGFALVTLLHQSHKQGFALVTLLHQSHKQGFALVTLLHQTQKQGFALVTLLHQTQKQGFALVTLLHQTQKQGFAFSPLVFGLDPLASSTSGVVWVQPFSSGCW